MTFDEFFQNMAHTIAQLVREGPPREFTVNRVNPQGKPYQQSATLPQLMAEQNDLLQATVIQNRMIIEGQKAIVEGNQQLLKAYKAMTKAMKDAAEEDE